MTDEQARAIGLRWLAAGGGWQDGVLVRYRGGILDGGAPRSLRWDRGATIAAYLVEWGAWPDPRDPATVGCWAARVREVTRHWCAHCQRLGGLSWFVISEDDGLMATGRTEAAAWLAALEAQP